MYFWEVIPVYFSKLILSPVLEFPTNFLLSRSSLPLSLPLSLPSPTQFDIPSPSLHCGFVESTVVYMGNRLGYKFGYMEAVAKHWTVLCFRLHSSFWHHGSEGTGCCLLSVHFTHQEEGVESVCTHAHM